MEKAIKARIGWGVLLVVLGALMGTSFVDAQGKWTAPASAKGMNNPVQKSDKVLAQAKKIFEQNCVACHGPKGLGDGPAGAALPVKPANWTSPAVQKETDGELFWKISEGRGPMPPWKTTLSENDRWVMVHFIRTLKK
jgi:mono/diheme cytochrome c family protein